MKLKTKILNKIPPLVDHSGPKTRQLLRSPGKFGLGQVPNNLTPDYTTPMVCGFCSTGCSLNIHIKDGKPVNLTPDSKYPVNIGMACPKGWEALEPLTSSDRATTPLIKSQSTGELEEATWEEAMTTFRDQFQAVQKRHGKES